MKTTLRPMLFALFAGALTLLIASGSTAHLLQAQEGERLSSRDITRQITEYAAEDTDEQRRAQIVANLAATGDPRTRNALRAALREQEQQLAIIRLVGELRHENCWELLGEFVSTNTDSEVRHAALDTIFQVRDERSISEVLSLWTARQSEAVLLQELADRLQFEGISAAQVEQVLREVGDSTRGESARQILGPHFMLTASESPETFRERWSEIREAYQRESRRHSIDGYDLLREGTFHGERIEPGSGLFDPNKVAEQSPWLPTAEFVLRRDANYLMEQRQRFEHDDLERFNRAAFTLTMRFMPLSSDVDNFNLGLSSQRNRYDCEVQDGEARIAIQRLRGSVTAPVRIGEWNELTYIVTWQGDTRQVSLRMNGSPFQFNGTPINDRRARANLGGSLSSIAFRAPQNGQVVIGGFDLRVTSATAGPEQQDGEEAEERNPWGDWRDDAERRRDRDGDRDRGPQGPRRNPQGPPRR